MTVVVYMQCNSSNSNLASALEPEERDRDRPARALGLMMFALSFWSLVFQNLMSLWDFNVNREVNSRGHRAVSSRAGPKYLLHCHFLANGGYQANG